MTIYMKLNMGVGVWGSQKHDCMVEKVKETSRKMLFPTGAGCVRAVLTIPLVT